VSDVFIGGIVCGRCSFDCVYAGILAESDVRCLCACEVLDFFYLVFILFFWLFGCLWLWSCACSICFFLVSCGVFVNFFFFFFLFFFDSCVFLWCRFLFPLACLRFFCLFLLCGAGLSVLGGCGGVCVVCCVPFLCWVWLWRFFVWLCILLFCFDFLFFFFYVTFFLVLCGFVDVWKFCCVLFFCLLVCWLGLC